MAYILDAAVILIFVFCIWNGWRRGFIKALSGLAAFVLALAVALLFSTPIAEGVYDNAVSPIVQETLIGNLTDNVSASITQSVDNALTDLPAYVRNLLNNQGLSSGADIVGKLSISNSDSMTAVAEQIDSFVVRPVAVALLRALTGLVLFVVVGIAASILLRLLDKVFRLPLLKGINRTLGILPGAINGVLWVLLLATLAQVGAAVATTDSFVSQAVLDNTTLLQWLVSVNPLGGTLQELMTVTL